MFTEMMKLLCNIVSCLDKCLEIFAQSRKSKLNFNEVFFKNTLILLFENNLPQIKFYLVLTTRKQLDDVNFIRTMSNSHAIVITLWVQIPDLL